MAGDLLTVVGLVEDECSRNVVVVTVKLSGEEYGLFYIAGQTGFHEEMMMMENSNQMTYGTCRFAMLRAIPCIRQAISAQFHFGEDLNSVNI